MCFSFSLPIHMCRLQPPPAVVLHDLLHHPARAPRFPRHERVQEEVRLGMGRVLPNCSVPDHSPCLLRNPSWTLLSWGLFWPNILAVKAHKNPNMNGLTDWFLESFFLTQEIFFLNLDSGLKVLQYFECFDGRKKKSLVFRIVWRFAFLNRKYSNIYF